MSLTSIMNAANSGLQTAQAQIRIVSDNVANVNTPGYVRKIAEQRSLSVEGVGAGVEISRIRLATDRFLQAATLTASADASRAGVRYELLDKTQSLFGDPTGDGGFFAMADRVFAAFNVTAEDPLSSPRRQEAIVYAKALLDEAARIAGGIEDARLDADTRIASAVDEVNGLLSDIEALNLEISRAYVAGQDTSGAESAQAQLIDQVAQYLDIRILPRANGGVTLRTGDGMLLAGNGAATLSYDQAGSVDARTDFNELWITEPFGQKRSMMDHLGSGELKGLIEYRDVEGPQMADRLAEAVSRIVDELNRAHNANSAAPAPATLTGRNTGLDLATAVSGFSGTTTVAITDSAGVIQRRVAIDFTAGTMSVDGGAATGFTPATFLATLNAGSGRLRLGELRLGRAQPVGDRRQRRGRGRRRGGAVDEGGPGLLGLLRPERPGPLGPHLELRHRPDRGERARVHRRGHRHLPLLQRRGRAAARHQRGGAGRRDHGRPADGA